MRAILFINTSIAKSGRHVIAAILPVLFMLVLLGGLVPSPSTSARPYSGGGGQPASPAGDNPSSSSSTQATNAQNCTGSGCNNPEANPNAQCSNDRCDLIKKYVNPTINLLTAVFGIIAVISLIIGGIQYTTSEGDSQKAAQAKKRIFNTVLAVVAYFFLYGFLQFLVPGGIFNRSGP